MSEIKSSMKPPSSLTAAARLRFFINMTSLICGIIFAMGLGISGMTLQNKVIGFLDLFGNWDMSLMFVMGGAVGVHVITYRLIMKRKTPLLEKQFYLPENKKVDKPLMIGSALFGIGWGLGGFCPGPAVVSLMTGYSTVIVFVVMMIIGMLMNRLSFVKKMVGS